MWSYTESYHEVEGSSSHKFCSKQQHFNPSTTAFLKAFCQRAPEAKSLSTTTDKNSALQSSQRAMISHKEQTLPSDCQHRPQYSWRGRNRTRARWRWRAGSARWARRRTGTPGSPRTSTPGAA